jgi:drug/metabolite transporter (DMT)-like permease
VTARPSLLTTAEGTSAGAFGASEWGLVAAISVIWGASFLFIANGLDSFGPFTVGFFRVGLGALTLNVMAATRRRRIDREDWPRLLLLAVVWMAIPLTLFPIAEQWVSSSLAGMLNGGMPIVSAALAAVLLRRRPGRRPTIGLLVGFAGIVLVGLPSLGEGASEVRGVLLIGVALLCYGVAANVTVPLSQKYGALVTQARTQALGALLTLPGGLWGLTQKHDVELVPVLSILALGIGGTGLAFVLAGRLIGRVGATRGPIFTYFIPLVSIVLGVTFRDDRLHALSFVGLVLVLSGAWTASRAVR